LEHVKRSAENDIARIRNRSEAEVADLKANIASLEANLEKVRRYLLLRTASSDPTKANRNHLLDLQTAHNEYSTELSALKARLERADDRAKDAELSGKAALQRALTVRLHFSLRQVILVPVIYSGRLTNLGHRLKDSRPKKRSRGGLSKVNWMIY
jgi:hypothetical protein